MMATTSLGISSSTAVFPSQKIVDGALPSSSSSLLPRPLMSKRKWHSTSWRASWSTRATFSRPSSSFSEGGRQQCVEGSSSSGSAIAMHYKNASAAAVDRGVRPLVTDPAASDAAAACGLFEGADEPSSCTDGGEPSFVVAEFGGSSPKLLHVAVDVDEVLGSFLSTLNTFIGEEYMRTHKLSEYHVYDFMKIWNCSQAEGNILLFDKKSNVNLLRVTSGMQSLVEQDVFEVINVKNFAAILHANDRVHAFFESEHFNNGILPIPGAYETLLQLASYCRLVVVTSRQHVIQQPTINWLEQHYSGIFKEVHFGNHFALEGEARPKSEICRSLGVQVLIDDNPRYALECAEHGIEVLLFDLHGSYPWSKTDHGPTHPLITRVHDWHEVNRALKARIR